MKKNSFACLLCYDMIPARDTCKLCNGVGRLYMCAEKYFKLRSKLEYMKESSIDIDRDALKMID